MEPFAVLVVGLGAGLLYGTFGAGGAAFATPVLALLGIPGTVAVTAPLPAMLPNAVAGVAGSVRNGTVDRRVATLAVAGGIPGSILGGLLSSVVGGAALVTLSAVLLLVVGLRVLLPDPAGHAARAERWRERGAVVVAMTFAVGVLTGLLANGGGFLLVPAFVVFLGLPARRAAATSLVVAAALSVPTLVVHWSLGHLGWGVALGFGAGSVPGTALGRVIADRVPDQRARRTFGALLVGFAAWFLVAR